MFEIAPAYNIREMGSIDGEKRRIKRVLPIRYSHELHNPSYSHICIVRIRNIENVPDIYSWPVI